MKFYFQSNTTKISEIGLLFRNFPKYVSLTVGDQKNGFVRSKKTKLQNFPSGRFSSRYAASYLFLIKNDLRVHTQRKVRHLLFSGTFYLLFFRVNV